MGAMDTPIFLIGSVVFLAVFTQSVSGFGVALVTMALIPSLIGIRVATPLVALVALVLEAVLLIRYYKSMNVRAVWRIAVAAVIGTPLGVIFLTRVDERIALALLGVVIAGYALYALLGLKLPRLENPQWAYVAGLIGGMLGGAYNTAGPPVVIYGDCRRWPPDVFKGNLQGYFVIASIAAAASHALDGNFTPQVWQLFWWTMPFLIVGTIVGLSLDRWINPAVFRKVVLALLVVMGVRMIFS